MIKTIIVEDTFDNRETLKKIISHDYPEIFVIGEAENIDQAYTQIKALQPDLIFLDIQLEKETSFDLLEKLYVENAINFEIIFVTGYGNFENAIRAIEYSALDFINKPIEADTLIKAVDKAKARISSKEKNPQIELLLEYLHRPLVSRRRIAFHLLKGIVEFVQVDDIVYCEADGVVTYIHLKDNTKLTAMKNLGHYSRILTSDYNFFQISNDTLINLDYVKRYNHGELHVLLTDGSHLYASRRGGQEFRKFLSEDKSYRKLEGSNGLLEVLKRIFKE